MRRRDLLQASGLAVAADLGAIVADDAAADVVEASTVDGIVERLPAPAETPDGRYDLTLAPGIEDAVLQSPAVLADADTHATLVSARVSLTVGVGVSPDAATDGLRRRGFQQSEQIEGGPMYVRRSRYKQQLAVVDEGTVVIGRGPDRSSVADLVQAVAVPKSEPLEERMPQATTVLDRLGTGAVLSVSPAGRRSRGDGPQPVAVGDRLALRSPGARLRTVAVYESASAASTARDRVDDSVPKDTAVVRDGATVRLDRSVPETELPPAVE